MSDTQQRIRDLVQSHDVLLFMKGSASFPMCGFSGRAVQILKACGVEPHNLATVNVLEDEAIRYLIQSDSISYAIQDYNPVSRDGYEIIIDYYKKKGDIKNGKQKTFQNNLHLFPARKTQGTYNELR